MLLCQIVSYLPTFQTYSTKINTFEPFSLPNTHHQKISIFNNKEIKKSTRQKKFQKKKSSSFSFFTFLFFFLYLGFSFFLLLLFWFFPFFSSFFLFFWWFFPFFFSYFFFFDFFLLFFFFFFGKQKTMMKMNYKLVVIVWS